MIKKREAGQAFILVLIILAIGALVVVPTLRLTTTVLKSNQIITQRNTALYACEAAQEKIMWMLYHDIDGIVSETLAADGDSANFTVDVCGTIVHCGVVMRAVEGKGGITLAGDDVIRPTKTVDPDTVLDGSSQTYTYIIKLEQLSDNTSQGLDAVYDILPKGFKDTTYKPDSSELRVDSGLWEPFPNPLVADTGYGGQIRLRWPASGNFTSPMRDFYVRQVKEIRFQVSGSLTDDAIHVNWVILDPWDTLSGPQARITVGKPLNPDNWGTFGMFEVGKVAEPEIVPPGVESDIKYTMSIVNHEGSAQDIEEIIDYLPPEFFYTDNSTSGDITSSDPQKDPLTGELPIETLNGVERQVLRWTSDEIAASDKTFAKGETKELVFWVRTTKEVSGSYYNEVEVRTSILVLKIVWEVIGPTTSKDPDDHELWNTAYSWNTGTVIVPAYDSSTGAGGENITANMGVGPDGVNIFSWHVD